MRLRWFVVVLALAAGPATTLGPAAAPALAAAPTSVDRAPYSVLRGLVPVKDLAIGADGRTYVLHDTSYEVFAAGARAGAEPQRTVTFTPGPGQAGSLVTVDADGWVTVVTQASIEDATVLLFAPTASGTATPALHTTDAELDIDQLADLTGVGDEVAFIDNNRNDIRVYDLRASVLTPVRVIPGGGTTRLVSPFAIDSDRAGRLAVSGADWVAVFAAGADGDVAPHRYVSGPRTTLSGDGAFVSNVALDDRGNLFAGSVRDGATRVLRFAAGATGDVAPATRLGGSRTGLVGTATFEVGPSGALTVLDVARRDRLSLFQPIGPYARPGAVPGLGVTGSAGSALRRISWRTASGGSVDTPVTSYVVRVVCSGRTRLSRTFGAATRTVRFDLGTFERGTCTARVAARSRVGTGAASSRAFSVRR